MQTKLREQVLALSGRMQSRDLSTANEEFTSFEKDMQAAAAAMMPSADKLKEMQWKDAMSWSRRRCSICCGRRLRSGRSRWRSDSSGGGGGGGGGSAGRDLASLFDLELDTEKNQYETAQTASPAEQQAKEVDDALAKLDALARRQEELAQKQQNAPQSFRAALAAGDVAARGGAAGEADGADGPERHSRVSKANRVAAGAAGQQGQQESAGPVGWAEFGTVRRSVGQSQGRRVGSSRLRRGSSRDSSGTERGRRDPRVTQALNRLREADEADEAG